MRDSTPLMISEKETARAFPKRKRVVTVGLFLPRLASLSEHSMLEDFGAKSMRPERSDAS
jgi:hypothetical protein